VQLLTLPAGHRPLPCADLDQFDLVNSTVSRRQHEHMGTQGEVMPAGARYQPQLDIRVFDDGVQPHNVDAFLTASTSTWTPGLFCFSRAPLCMTPAARAHSITFAFPWDGGAVLNFCRTAQLRRLLRLRHARRRMPSVSWSPGAALLHGVIWFIPKSSTSRPSACRQPPGVPVVRRMAGTEALKILLAVARCVPCRTVCSSTLHRQTEAHLRPAAMRIRCSAGDCLRQLALVQKNAG